MPLQIVRNDITKMKVDAILSYLPIQYLFPIFWNENDVILAFPSSV